MSQIGIWSNNHCRLFFYTGGEKSKPAFSPHTPIDLIATNSLKHRLMFSTVGGEFAFYSPHVEQHFGRQVGMASLSVVPPPFDMIASKQWGDDSCDRLSPTGMGDRVAFACTYLPHLHLWG